METLRGQVVCVTGASSGIGEACAHEFARAGSRLLLVARRADRLEALEPRLRELGAADVLGLRLDVRNREAVFRTFASLAEPWSEVEVLVNNAGLSRGLEPLHQGEPDDWDEMVDTNIKGLLYVDRAVVPGMVSRRRGTVIHIGSISGRQVYPGGAVYCATKHAVRAVTDGLRLDLLGTGVRVCSVDPGLVDTEFSLVRFKGDTRRARRVYQGMRPLTGEDVARAVRFAAEQPPHVQVAEILVLPTDQASVSAVHRRSGGD